MNYAMRDETRRFGNELLNESSGGWRYRVQGGGGGVNGGGGDGKIEDSRHAALRPRQTYRQQEACSSQPRELGC